MDSRSILIVDDSNDDVEFAIRALSEAGVAGPFRSVTDGDEAIAYLGGHGDYADRERHPMPRLVLLDLKMPRVSGFDVLQWLRERPDLRRVVVVVVSSSMDGRDVGRAYDLGANAYVPKAAAGPDRERALSLIAEFWLQTALMPNDTQ